MFQSFDRFAENDRHIHERLGLLLVRTKDGLTLADWKCYINFSPDHQGIENVLTLVMNLMASITPSLMPRPESLTPPNGEHSIR